MKIVFIILSLLAATAYADTPAPSDITCTSMVYNDHTDKFTYGTLAQSSYDANYLEGKILTYAVGVDKFFLKNNQAIGMVITDNNSQNASTAMVGWQNMGKTQTAELNFFRVLKDNSRDQVQISCSRTIN